MKFVLFILNFRNSNLNEFDLTKILEKEKGLLCIAMSFIHKFNIIFLFLIYITFLDLRDVTRGNISKI
jgi:hypothetical protein